MCTHSILHVLSYNVVCTVVCSELTEEEQFIVELEAMSKEHSKIEKNQLFSHNLPTYILLLCNAVGLVSYYDHF